MLEFKGRRLFDTELGYGITALASRWDYYRYDDAPPPGPNEWERIQVGEYRTLRYGGAVSVGSQIARLGNATVDYTWQKVETQNLENSADLEESFTLGMVRFATLLDNKDRYPFPTRGILLSMGLEIAAGALGGSVNYTAFRGVYEFYSPIVGQLVLHPKVTVGFADNTMPLAQQFHLGGRESFFGLHEDDSRGRQLFVVNLELRQRLPFEIFFETYIRLRYDLGTISTQPEALKFSTFRHALGMEAAFDTPIGPAVFAAGKAFFFSRNLPENPLQSGPLLLYMTIGYQIF
jgi:NTE family protein